jgi:hypothetical protein
MQQNLLQNLILSLVFIGAAITECLQGGGSILARFEIVTSYILSPHSMLMLRNVTPHAQRDSGPQAGIELATTFSIASVT